MPVARPDPAGSLPPVLRAKRERRRERPASRADAAPVPHRGPADRDPDLAARLAREAPRFEFFQAVRLLAKLRPGRGPDPALPGGDPAGDPAGAGGGDGGDRGPVCRFRTTPSLRFPASAIHALDPAPPADGNGAAGGNAADSGAAVAAGPPTVWLNHFGLTGPQGVLPRVYTRRIQQRRAASGAADPTLHEFLDLFTHRLAGLFYRAWAKYRPWAAHERAAAEADRARRAGPAQLRDHLLNREAEADPAGEVLLAVAGVAEPYLRLRESVRDRPERRLAVGDDELRFYAGLLAGPNRSRDGLEAILNDRLGLPVRVESFVGQWLPLDPADRCRLGGGRPGAAGEAARTPPRLGRDATVGTRVRDVQGRFRLVVGPVGLDDFRALLPGGPLHRPAADLARLYAGPEFDFDFELRLRREEIPPLRAGGPDARLGFTTWAAAGSRREPYAAVTVPRPRNPRRVAAPDSQPEASARDRHRGTA